MITTTKDTSRELFSFADMARYVASGFLLGLTTALLVMPYLIGHSAG